MPDLQIAQLERMLESRVFVVRPRMAALLMFFVEESLRNGGQTISQRRIATHALTLSDNFRPTQSSYVRTNVARLRQTLADYYAGVGRDDPIVFNVTPGPYQLIATERGFVGGSADERPCTADRVYLKPTLLIVEADGTRCPELGDGFGRDVSSRLMMRLVDSPFVRVSGQLLRSRLVEGELNAADATYSWGYGSFCTTTLGPLATDRIDCTTSVIQVPNGRQILDERAAVGLTAGELPAECVADWLFHRISEAFMRERLERGASPRVDNATDDPAGATGREDG